MLIAIQNKALKSFVDRLQALKDSYPISVLTMTALDGAELFCLDVDIEEDELASFALDAQFGFGHDFKIERVLNDINYDHQTEYYIELNSSDNFEQELLELRKRLYDARINYRALEYSKLDDASVIRAYASTNQDQEAIAQFVG